MPSQPWSQPLARLLDARRSDRLLPPAGTSAGVALALVASTLPSLLPRSAPVQGLLSGGLVLIALALVAAGRRVLRAVREPGNSSPAARWATLLAASAAVLVAVSTEHLQLGGRTAALALPGPSPAYWALAAATALAAAAVGVALAAGARHTLQAAGRTGRARVTGLLAAATMTTAAAWPGGLLDPLRKDLAPDHPLLSVSAVGATRSFAAVDEAPTPEAGARLAVDRLVDGDGLERSAVVVVLPTGSGWVNGPAVDAIEADLGGDVAVVSAQYSDLPSWYQYLLDQDAALRSGTALLTDVLDRVDDLPAEDRPDVYVYGESLGALVGQAAVAQVPPEEVCGVLWSGAPGATVTGHPHERSLLNADDPIRYLATSTAFERPEGWPTVWVPLLSWGTTWLDTSASLLPAPGHGHVYGAEQDWSLPRC